MILSWLRRRRRRRLLASPFPSSWEGYLESLPVYGMLDDAERDLLRSLTRVIVAEKHWEGCRGLVMNDEVRATIAAQAAVLLLGIEHDHFRQVRSVYVYPSTFALPEKAQRGGVIARDVPVLGLAFHRGPVILAWDSVRGGIANPGDGRNVVLHEFAHKLDLLDGAADGTPLLRTRADFKEWVTVFQEEYERLREAVRRGRRTVLDAYGATEPAEFFAVATECFFEKPRQLRDDYGELYEVLTRYFGQDPGARIERDGAAHRG